MGVDSGEYHRSVVYAYDTLGRLEKVTDAENGETVFSYDTANRSTAIEDAADHHTLVGYDSAGRVTSVTPQLPGAGPAGRHHLRLYHHQTAVREDLGVELGGGRLGPGQLGNEPPDARPRSAQVGGLLDIPRAVLVKQQVQPGAPTRSPRRR